MRKKQFKAESKRLLDLMINSIYTHQEIFLREIISNASDAMDKLAYTALTDDKVSIDRNSFAITLIGRKNFFRLCFHFLSFVIPPPLTIQWICGW